MHAKYMCILQNDIILSSYRNESNMDSHLLQFALLKIAQVKIRVRCGVSFFLFLRASFVWNGMKSYHDAFVSSFVQICHVVRLAWNGLNITYSTVEQYPLETGKNYCPLLWMKSVVSGVHHFSGGHPPIW